MMLVVALQHPIPKVNATKDPMTTLGSAVARMLPRIPNRVVYVGWPGGGQNGKNNVSFEVEKSFTNSLVITLTKVAGEVQILGPQDVGRRLQARGLLRIDAFGVVSDKSIGALIGADTVVESRLEERNNTWRVNIDLVDIRTNRIRTAVADAVLARVGDGQSSNGEKAPPVQDRESGVYLAGIGGVGKAICLVCPAPLPSKEISTGKLWVAITINPDGEVVGARVLEGSRGQLVSEATETLATLHHWKFKPAVGPAGIPVPVRMGVEFSFFNPSKNFRGLHSVPVPWPLPH